MADYIHFGSGLLYQVWIIGSNEAQLAYLRNGLTGEELHFEKYEPFSFLTVPAEAYSTSIERTSHTASAFSFEEAYRNEDDSSARFHLTYANEDFRVAVTYEHVVGRSWIRKSLQITNLGPPVYVAGIVLQDWRIRPGNERIEELDCGYRFAYPAYGASRTPDQYMTRLGMPAVMWGRDGGLIAGIEFPGSHTDTADNQYRTDYRPGARLETGECLESEAAVQLAFGGREFSAAVAAFTEYIAGRYPPRVPSPVRFNTCGAWLEQATEERVLATMPLAKEMGADVYVIDFGWSQYDGYPFSFGRPEQLPSVEQVEAGFWRRELFPSGLDRIHRQAKQLGMRLGLHYETSGFPHIQEVDEWKLNGTVNEGYCLCTSYGDQFESLVLRQIELYDLGEIKLDFFTTEPCYATEHDHLADGYDSTGKQVLRALSLMRRARDLRPDIVISLFTGGGYTSPWWLAYADQLHSGDPGHNVMFRAMLEENGKSQAMALERRDRWHWATTEGMRPAHCVQMDVHGYGIQATGTAAARMDRRKDDSIPLGAGWEQTLFSNLALTQARDIKVNPWYLSDGERDFIASWLRWGASNAERLRRPRSLFGPPTGRTLEGYAHIDSDGGFVFLFNPAERAIPLHIDLSTVFGEGNWRADCIYPERASWGQVAVSAVIAPKDCVVLEVTESEASTARAVDGQGRRYSAIAQQIERPHQPVIVPGWSALFEALRQRHVVVQEEEAHHPRESRLLREAKRLVNLATVGTPMGDGADPVEVRILGQAQIMELDEATGGFIEAVGRSFWQLPDGRLVDGGVVIGAGTEDRLEKLAIAATHPEHFARLLNKGVNALMADRDLRTTEVLDDPGAYKVASSTEAVPLISPLHSRSVRIVSAVADDLSFSLAEVVMGSSTKLGRPPSRRRGFLFLPPPGGQIGAQLNLRLPAADQVVLRFHIGITDQMAPSFGVSLADRCDGVRFLLDIVGDQDQARLLDEPVFPELYPSGEMLEYPKLLPEGLHNDFLRPMVLDVSRWQGQDVSLELAVEAGAEHSSLHCLPIWTPPTILRTP